ncbi:MAG: hypothetical protein EOS56_30895, partial [Mesorhizobium sp.]
CGQPLLPVTIRGEVPGRAMRGGADFDNWCVPDQYPLISRGPACFSGSWLAGSRLVPFIGA